jgi:hypothetical protein
MYQFFSSIEKKKKLQAIEFGLLEASSDYRPSLASQPAL